MANIEKLRELELGSEVKVITKGQYQIVDVASSIKIPPLAECTVKLTPFIENQLRLGTLALVGEDDAPKAENDSLSEDELGYASEDTVVELDKTEKPASDNSSTGNEALTSTAAPRSRGRRAAAAPESDEE